jgi:hypothetical protein
VWYTEIRQRGIGLNIKSTGENMAQSAIKEGMGLTVHIIIYKEDGELTAHCLEMDLVTTGESIARVKKDIEDLIIAQLNFATKNNNLDNVFKPAPDKYWSMLAHAKKCNKKKISDGRHDHKVGNLEYCLA